VILQLLGHVGRQFLDAGLADAIDHAHQKLAGAVGGNVDDQTLARLDHQWSRMPTRDVVRAQPDTDHVVPQLERKLPEMLTDHRTHFRGRIVDQHIDPAFKRLFVALAGDLP